MTLASDLRKAAAKAARTLDALRREMGDSGLLIISDDEGGLEIRDAMREASKSIRALLSAARKEEG